MFRRCARSRKVISVHYLRPTGRLDRGLERVSSPHTCDRVCGGKGPLSWKNTKVPKHVLFKKYLVVIVGVRLLCIHLIVHVSTVYFAPWVN